MDGAAGRCQRNQPGLAEGRETVHGGDVNGASAGGGGLWFAAADAPAVLRVDPTYGTIKRFKLPTDDLQDWNLNPDNALYAAGSLWVTQGFQTLRRIDPDDGHVLHSCRPLFGAQDLAAGDGAVFVSSPPQGLVKRIDPADDHVVWTAKLHPWLSGPVVAGGYLWVGTNSDPTLFKFDLATGHQLKAIPTGSPGQQHRRWRWRPCGWRTRAAAPSPASTWPRSARAASRSAHAPAGLLVVGRRLWVGLTPSPDDELKGVTGKVATLSLREDWLDGQSDPATTWGERGPAARVRHPGQALQLPG